MTLRELMVLGCSPVTKIKTLHLTIRTGQQSFLGLNTGDFFVTAPV
jgi:hypothetical protein